MGSILWHYVKGHFKVFGQFYVILLMGWVAMAISGYYNNVKYELKICNANLQSQNDAIEDLQIKAIEKQKEYEKKAKLADKAREDYMEKAKAIMNEKVTNNCSEAINLGIKYRLDI